MDSNGDLSRKSRRHANKCAEIGRILVKEEIKARVKQVAFILKKSEDCRTVEDIEVLQQSPEIVQSIDKRAKVRDVAKQRLLEVEDDPALLESKCEELAKVLRTSKNVVVYTGAGISTAASIPDYRGPNGVWTLLQQGKEIKALDLSDAEPTLTHMAIAKLHHLNIVKYVVSQNCDGLHLRSGLSRQALSEVHGDMFMEVCRECKPRREYIRLFDVTEKTGVRRHSTGRSCHVCHKPLQDTIVHFGEKGGLYPPYNWQKAADSVEDCDMILCLGSSLKILRKYACLWFMDLRPKDRPKLFIVNLQWTPKDDIATLKINGKCDDVLRKVMNKLNIQVPKYKRAADPLFKLSMPLLASETDTTSKKILKIPQIIEPNQFSHAAQSLRRLQKSKKKKKASVSKGCETERCSLEIGVKSDLIDTDSQESQCSTLELGVKSDLIDTDSQESQCSTSSDSVVIIDEKLPKPTTSNQTKPTDQTRHPYKLDHPLLRQKLGFLKNIEFPFTASKNSDNENGSTNPMPSVSLSINGFCKKEVGKSEQPKIEPCISELLEDETCESEPCQMEPIKSERFEIELCKSEQHMSTSHNCQNIKMKGLTKDQCMKITSVSIIEAGEVSLCGDSPNSGPKEQIQLNTSNNKTPSSPGTSLPGWFGKGFNPRKRKRKL